MRWIKKLMGREQQVQHTPVRRNEWEQVVRRLDLPEATKLIALLMATFANPDGSSVRPGDELLADLCDWSQKHVREQIKILRKYGLIECVSPAARRRAAVYQLTFPGEGTEPAPMRVDPYGARLTERLRGRGGRKPRLTGTPVPMLDDDDRNWSSGESSDDRNSSSPQSPDEGNSSSGQDASESPMDGTGVPVTERSPELEFPMTGTPVPNDRNSSSPHHYRPHQDQSWVKSDSTPTSAQDQKDESEIDPPDTPRTFPAATDRQRCDGARKLLARFDDTRRGVLLGEAWRLLVAAGYEPTWNAQRVVAAHLLNLRQGPISVLHLPADPDKAYLDGRALLNLTVPEQRDAALTEAGTELRELGLTGDRPRVIYAAEILARWTDEKD